MTTLHYVNKARKNIYEQGKEVKKVHKSGKHKGQSYTDIDTSQPANKKDKIYIKKGEPYYWYQFAFGSKRICKNKPRRSQYATRSEHLGAIYDIEDQLEDMKAIDLQDGCLDDLIQEIEQIVDTCQERLDNMPEQLQEAPSGQILQEYIYNCETWREELEQINFSDIDEDFRAQAESEVNEEEYTEDGEFDNDAYNAAIDELAATLEYDAREELLKEIQNCTYQG